MIDEDEWLEMMEPELTATPVDMEDVNSFGERLDEAMWEARSIFSRLRHTYRGDTWMSQEVWAMCCKIEEVFDRMQYLCENGAFPEKH